MARIRDIQRTAAFAWSPDTAPFIATGTQAGAVAADFSDSTFLEIWDLDLENVQVGGELAPVASISTNSKFYDIAWGKVSNEKPRGIIAGALENGSLDLWSVDALLNNSGDPLISRTTKHTGAIKSLQFNPFKSDLLATAGSKGELYVWDLNNTENPFLLGNRAARADDFDCLDWNKKVPHILVTGGNGGFVTVWDVKTKKESLTLNNLGRKAVSAVAWHPEQQTKLITAIPDDTNPVILLWDLRNSNAPERTLSGHELGVLSLSWCKQDTDLLLSCGKDNKTICWNPQTGEKLGEFPVVANWTFKTEWNPRNPSLSATASFDGKIVVQTLQNTNPASSQVDTSGSTQIDADDFFSRAGNAQTSSFTLKQPPKWLRTPVGASFGFGGKLVSFTAHDRQSGQPGRSRVRITSFAVDSGVNSAVEAFERALKEGNLVNVCDLRSQDAKAGEEKADWRILRALFESNPRDKLIEYLGFNDDDSDGTDSESETKEVNGQGLDQPSGAIDGRDKRLSSFFADAGADSDNFLADLSSIQSTRGAKTNNPFQILTGDESEADRKITRAVVLGQFEKAVDVCLKEDRISDAFMLAICGGEKCIEKVKAAYFTKNVKGPNYLRVLASIVGKNLWDVVHNANLSNWKEVMVALCSFADDKDFPDLCEVLGERLEEEEELRQGEGITEARKHASFCYLAGSKLDKVVNIWIEELIESERAGLEETSGDSTFSLHARSLQNFIEKVTVFREGVKFVDEEKELSSGWKLHALYEKYCEYADVVAAHGQLQVAERYLDLLPTNYPAATVARNRVKEASGKGSIAQVRKPQQPATTTAAAYGTHQLQATKSPYQPQQQTPTAAGPTNPYAPSAPAAAPANPFGAQSVAAPSPYATPTAAVGTNPYALPAVAQGYKPSAYQQMQPAPNSTPYVSSYPGYNPSVFGQPPPRNFSPVASVPPPSQAANMANWNDTPNVTKMPRRTTPSGTPAPVTSPFPGAPGAPSPPMPPAPFGAPPPRGASVPPPPKNAAPPQRVQSPAQHQYRPHSPATQAPGPYAPSPQGFPPSQPGYPNAPPPPASASRYAPAPAVAGPAPQARQNQPLPPPPQGSFAGPRQTAVPQYAPPPSTFSQQPPPPPYAPVSSPNQGGQYYPPPGGQGPPSQPPSQLESATPPKAQTPAPLKHPAGDRTHIPPQYRPIFELLSTDMERVKLRAPNSFQRQVKDTEKRLNILFDHINNEEVLSQEALESMLELSRALRGKDYATAHSVQVDLVTNRTSECNIWMPGVKRLIEMSRATPES